MDTAPTPVDLVIVPASLAVVVEPDGASLRLGVTGQLEVLGDLAIDRVRVALVGRAGERVVLIDESGYERESIVDGRLPFATSVSVKTPTALSALEVRAYAVGTTLVGAGQVAAADVPSASDATRGPLALDLAGGRLSVQQRPETTDNNVDVFGALISVDPRLTRGSVELVCLDADERPLFRDDSSFDTSFGAPVFFKVVFWPKIGAWRATRSVLVRVRGEVLVQARPVVVDAASFEPVEPPVA